MGVITVEVDPEKLREDSVIFQGEGRPLNSYQHAVNDAALKLCLDDPSLVKQRGKLVSLAREQVHNEGYQYKKKKSRSKAFGSSASQSTESPVAKKPRLSQELRSTRIREVEEDLTELDTRLRYLEKAREKFATVTGIVTEQVEEKETLVSDKHDDNSECSEDDVKEKDVRNLLAACSNDVPFLDEGQRHKSKMKN